MKAPPEKMRIICHSSIHFEIHEEQIRRTKERRLDRESLSRLSMQSLTHTPLNSSSLYLPMKTENHATPPITKYLCESTIVASTPLVSIEETGKGSRRSFLRWRRVNTFCFSLFCYSLNLFDLQQSLCFSITGSRKAKFLNMSVH